MSENVDNIIGRLINNGDTEFVAPAWDGKVLHPITWHRKGTIVSCRGNGREVDLCDPHSLELLKAAHSYCMAHGSCQGCGLQGSSFP